MVLLLLVPSWFLMVCLTMFVPDQYLPKEKRLAGFDRALIPKRALDEETEEKLLNVMANVVEAYDLKPVLADHPFK